MYSYLYSRKPVSGKGRGRTQSCHALPLSYIYLNLLLDVLVCSIALHFYSFVFFLLTPRARENTTQLVKTYRDKHLIRSIYKQKRFFFKNMMGVTLTPYSEGFNFIDDYLYMYIISFQDLEYYLLKGEQI